MDALNEKDYQRLRNYIYDKLGIEVDEKKKETVTTKVLKITGRRKINSPKEYIDFLLATNDKEAIQEFFNEITTNTTEFFRENAHFEYIKANISTLLAEIPRIKQEGEIRVWSAPCSSGEEPITIAITLKELLPANVNIKILATDISEKILHKAQKGLYTEAECKEMPKQFLQKYFAKQSDGFFEINGDIKKCITYRLFNLMDDFRFQKGFDIIFCRNVMIYFDNTVQQKLISKFYNALKPNGLFFIGHSESMLNKTHSFKYVQAAVYKK